MSATCVSCHADNDERRSYCGRCGASLNRWCPRCAFRNHASDAFCGGCGEGLPQETPRHAEPAKASRPPATTLTPLPRPAPSPAPGPAPSAAPRPPAAPLRSVDTPVLSVEDMRELLVQPQPVEPPRQVSGKITQDELDRLFAGQP